MLSYTAVSWWPSGHSILVCRDARERLAQETPMEDRHFGQPTERFLSSYIYKTGRKAQLSVFCARAIGE